MERAPFTIAPMRLGGTSRSRANWLMLIPNGFMKSSRRISPGWIGSSCFDGFIGRTPSALVVIDYRNVVRIAATPSEADAPLVINSNAILSRAVAFQQFKPVSRRHAKILQSQRPVQVQKFPPGRPFDGLKSPHPVVLKERRGIRALERPDQASVYDVSGIMSNVMVRKGVVRRAVWRFAAIVSGRLALSAGRMIGGARSPRRCPRTQWRLILGLVVGSRAAGARLQLRIK